MYDITSTKSFESLNSWKEEFLTQSNPKDPENFPFVAIGNKLDKEQERKVSTAKASQWCKNNNNLPFFEVSAKDAINVDDAFSTIARNALAQVKEEEVFQPSIDLKAKRKTENKKGCCVIF